jgi:hypothetical protein
MLAGAEARGLPGCTIDHIRLQGMPEGHSLDDVIVHAHDGSGKAVSLEIQVKRHISFAPADKVFASAMEQVSAALLAPDFWDTRLELAVATAHHSRQIDGAYQDILTWARELGDAASFHKRLTLPDIASEPMRTFVSTFRDHLKANGAPADDQTVWKLLRRFHILVFDFTAETSADRDLAQERAVRVLLPGHEHLASELWRSLIERSIKIAASGGDRTRDQLLAESAGGFEFAPMRRHQEALARLEEFSRQALEDIETQISGVRLSRQRYVNQLWECLEKGRYIDIRGDAGVGKSGILRHFAEQLASQGRIVVLSPNRTYLRGWGGMRLELDFHGTCRELLSELSANGAGAIFVDNLDFFRAEERPTVIDLLREAVSIPGMVVVTTARRASDAVERSWLPKNLLDQLGRTPVISVEEMDDQDRNELRSGATQLVQLLSEDHPARAVLSNLFRLSQLAERADSESLPRTEAEMAIVWWQTGGSNQSEGRRERARFLKDLAEDSLAANHSFNTSHWAPAPIDSLIKNETLLELKADTVIFRHDVFREWAMACLLFDEADRVSQLPLTKPARPDLARAAELVARMKIENASDAADWLGLLAALSAPGTHSSWRRAVLLALVRSEASPQILNTTAPAMVYDHAALLCELIRLVLAVEVMPARARFVAAGLDEKNVPASMTVPAGLSWIRLMAWIAYRVREQLPPAAIPDVVKLYSGWCISFKGRDPFSPTLVEQMYRWLREIEESREPHPHWDNPGVFAGAIQGEQLKSLEETLRFYFIAFAYHVPHLAAEYLNTFKTRTYSEDIKLGILRFRGSLAMAAPAELAEFTLATLIPQQRPTRRSDSVRQEGPFGFTDGKFLPCSPSQGPFLELLTHSPQNGLRLIRRLVDYSISFFSQGANPGQDGITIQLADGPRFFPWVRTYIWSREAAGGPYLVTSGLMALEAWAHRRLDNGDPFEAVLKDVMGEPGAPVAYLLPVVDLILSHWEKAVVGAVAFAGSPELLALDRPRWVRDNPPKLPKPAIFEELEQLQKEPPGIVSNEDLKKRNSRKFMLDQVIGNYTFLTEQPELRDQVRNLLTDARDRLAPPTKSQGLFHPECMVLHALNKLNPENFSTTTLPLKGGGTIEVPFYKSTVEEAAHLEGLEREGISQDNPTRSMRYEIKAAIQDPERSTKRFFEDALAFAQNAVEDPQSEDEPWPGTVSPRVEDAISLAFLIARDGSPELRQEQAAWMKNTFALSFSDNEKETHRYRSEYQFNPQAFSFAGHVWLLKREKNEENIRFLLSAASFKNPQASVGFKAMYQHLAEVDERLIRSILRTAFTAQIRPGRDWQIRQTEREQQTVECEQNVASRIGEETSWLLGKGDEPDWPLLPQVQPTLRNTYYHKASDNGGNVSEDLPIDQFNFSYHAAAEWLKAAKALFDTAADPWLRHFLAFYRTWTVIANGAGVDKSEQIDGTPEAWNEVYFQLVAASLTDLPLAEVEARILAYFAEMPDEPLFKNLKTFLEAIDRSFFNRNALSPEVAVLVRTLTGSLLQSTRGWEWLQKDRTDSVEMHIADVVSTYYFNNSGSFLAPSKCYLLPAAIPRITPFLKPLLTLALDCHSPRIGAVALNLIEVSPTAEHLSFLIALGSTWVSTYQGGVQFWIEFQFGTRISSLFETILIAGVRDLSPADTEALDQLLGHLVKLGIPDALRAEDLLRAIDLATNGPLTGDLS